ncbi:MAG: AMP-binding protein, partial [Lachnospiraceae bacterium]|nr:AMP-binding protein [Lachnospiraceae bacterium]
MCRLVTDYLDKTVNEYPDKTAFIDFKRVITFQELKDEASAIASAIIDRNVFRKPILLFMNKSVSTVSSFIGIAYSGNFYTPVDIKMPDDRIGKILNILDPAIVITDKEHEEQARTIFAGRDIMVFEDEVSRPVLNDRITDVRSRLTDADTLYVFFTSGSTGIPKGVIISHRAAVDYTEWISDCYGFDEKTVFANQAQLYFDASIQDIYAPLRNGSTTLLIPNRLFASPVRAWKEIIRHKANTLFWVPSVLCLFANFDVLSHVEKVPLKTVLFCGEVMPVKQLNYWIENYPDVIYANLYGPTECTDACTYYTIDRKFKDNEALPIGKPCANTEVYVITEEGALADSPGVTGELYISGKCLSDGYY